MNVPSSQKQQNFATKILFSILRVDWVDRFGCTKHDENPTKLCNIFYFLNPNIDYQT